MPIKRLPAMVSLAKKRLPAKRETKRLRTGVKVALAVGAVGAGAYAVGRSKGKKKKKP